MLCSLFKKKNYRKGWKLLFRRADTSKIGCGFMLKVEKKNKHFQLKSYLTCIYCSYNMTLPHTAKPPCNGCFARDSTECIHCLKKRQAPYSNNGSGKTEEKPDTASLDVNDKYRNLCSGKFRFVEISFLFSRFTNFIATMSPPI